MTLYDNAFELYNECLENYFDEYKALSDAQKRKVGIKYDTINLFVERYNYDVWFENEESPDTTRKMDKTGSVHLSDVPPLEADEGEVKQGK